MNSEEPPKKEALTVTTSSIDCFSWEEYQLGTLPKHTLNWLWRNKAAMSAFCLHYALFAAFLLGCGRMRFQRFFHGGRVGTVCGGA